MEIDYDHARNLHSLPGPRAAVPVIFADARPQSLLDVGCGIGTWLMAAQEFGVTDIFGVDGVAKADRVLIPRSAFRHQDLTQAWNLGRRFDAALCLEVAEHLDTNFAGVLIDALVMHSDCVFFGAACPGQPGQHHVNCQWPVYWQNLFNKRGYVCTDQVRWRIWDDERIESWYRQNMFVASRNADQAGREPRIPSVIHPGIYRLMIEGEFPKHVRRIEEGTLPFAWYLEHPMKVMLRKAWRKII